MCPGFGSRAWRVGSRRADGSIWRGIRTPEGTVTLRISSRPATGDVHAEAWGSGAEWALDRLPTLLGAEDDVTGFEPRHPVLALAWRSHGDWRLTRTGLVMEALVPAVIEQKVTGQEAFRGFRTSSASGGVSRVVFSSSARHTAPSSLGLPSAATR